MRELIKSFLSLHLRLFKPFQIFALLFSLFIQRAKSLLLIFTFSIQYHVCPAVRAFWNYLEVEATSAAAGGALPLYLQTDSGVAQKTD